jgi:hypothetical protein
MDAVPFPGKSITVISLYLFLADADFIQGFQGTASALNVTISGVDQT